MGTVQDPREPDEKAPNPPGEGTGEPRTARPSESSGTPEPPEPSETPEPPEPSESSETTEAPGPEGEHPRGTAVRSLRLRWKRWAPDPRDLSWRGLVPWRHRSARFEPGPLGLLGVMLAAMAATLLLIQSGSGGIGGAGGDRADGPVTVPGPPAGELRVMVVGDSLTQGSSGDYTWRYHLWSHLRETGVEADFVGPYDGMYGLDEGELGNQDYADPDFDTDHAALWGASSGELASDVARVAAEHDPHYLLLLAGTEDILSGDGADRALEGIGEAVSTVRVVRGDTRFVLGELPPVEGTGDDGRINAEIDRFNMGVVDLAGQLTANDSPVVVARVADGYVPSRDNWDEVHPNTRGEVRIAAAFADVLADPLGVGRAYPRPLPDPPVGPQAAPEPVAEESDEGLLLSWEAVPGATDYRVAQRRVSPDPDGPSVLPVGVESDGDSRSVLVEALFSGARYEFVVRPYKGRDEGAESEPLQLVWDDDPPPAPSWVRVADGGATVEWEEVEEASHYEVWARVLECSVADDRRVPADTADSEPPTGEPTDGDGAGPSAGDGEPPRTEPDPTPGPRPDPEPAPEPGPPPPAPSTPGPDVSCEPRDGHGPEEGRGWRTLGSVGEEPHWSATLSGSYEIVVRSYRDYVEGGYSGSVLLSES
ncbi:GDSL family lipase [Nocardiopsis sp. TSRI0078]|uniref:GDSL-type esterase/lipase family protein n=1 Tax=unclassified Nocardiopsis TaxID=2649073 RepID=UPI00093D3282|nr:GDSL-type esterase/lipase family protein [Nocardiopsis sp. TSRI0078]OKI15130.1 GDSL family lipase [Nocardiopsis sp. TSRI0078]